MPRSREQQPVTTNSNTPSDRSVEKPDGRLIPNAPATWRRLALWEYAAVTAVVMVVALTALPYLPPDICFGDNGDLQLASITLGIMHPPGYAGFTTLGYLISRVPIVDKPFLITLACLASGLAVLWLCTLMQMRLGLNTAAASLLTMLFAAHKRFWFNIIAPEIYMPSLACLALGAYLLMKYAHTARVPYLAGSALCLGFCIGNRPTALLTVPFFVIAYVAASRRLSEPLRRCLRNLAVATGCALLPVAYSFAYVLIRDNPTTAYNYLDQHNRAHHVLPDTQEGLSARMRRAVWLLSAEQFRPEFGTTWNRLQSKLRWLRDDLLYAQPVRLTLALVLVVVGTVICYHRDAVAAWLVMGIGFHSLLFVCIYRVYGQAADLLPFVFAATVMLGVALSAALPQRLSCSRAFGVLAVGAVLVVTVWKTADVPTRWKVARDSDAVPFLTELDPASLPADTLILSGWAHAVPLWYMEQTSMHRPDIDVLAGEPGQLEYWCRTVADRPVIMAHQTSDSQGLHIEPYRNVWRVVRPETKSSGTSIDK